MHVPTTDWPNNIVVCKMEISVKIFDKKQFFFYWIQSIEKWSWIQYLTPTTFFSFVWSIKQGSSIPIRTWLRCTRTKNLFQRYGVVILYDESWSKVDLIEMQYKLDYDSQYNVLFMWIINVIIKLKFSSEYAIAHVCIACMHACMHVYQPYYSEYMRRNFGYYTAKLNGNVYTCC